MSKPTDILQFDGKNCSRVYTRMLTVCRADGVHFELDSGYRTSKEQWRLWLAHKRDPKHNPVAAFPGTSAHGKKGYKQALDINSTDGGTQRVLEWLRKHGMVFRLTVQGEAWHIEASADYTNHIYNLWSKYETEQERRQVELRRKLEDDRKTKLKKKH